MANYNLTIRTLSPMHIGTGHELRQGFDYIIYEGTTRRLDTDRILEAKYDPKYPNRLPGEMIRGEETNRSYLRYVLEGTPRSTKNDSRLRECIKDVHDVPYIPGSSIKGAIRTAVGAAILASSSMQPAKELWNLKGKAQNIDNDLNEKLFGEEPRTDLFRALLISDACLSENSRVPEETMLVRNSNPITLRNTNSSVPVELECINRMLDFHGSVKIDEYALENNNFSNKELLSKQMIKIIRDHSEKRLQKLQEWYKKAAGAEKINSFLDQLLKHSENNLQKTENKALMQMGFGTGWDGMTYSEWILSDDDFFEDLFIKQRLGKKQTKWGAPIREPGTDFPTSRKVVLSKEKPIFPLGWVLLTLEPK